MKRLSFRKRDTVYAAMLSCAALVACGGGGGDGEAAAPAPEPAAPAPVSPAPPPAPILASLTGNVFVDQAVRNAIVCLDLNANSACDADEPVSARTNGDGAYNVSYDTAKVTGQQVASASLIAPMVPGAATDANTTYDAANPASAVAAKAYVLKQVPGKGGPINPLTTLVAAGVAAGMTEAAARSNTAFQLGIAETKIDSYQDDPVSDPNRATDTARFMAKVTASALEAGAALEVGDQNAAVPAAAGDLASLVYTSNGNYSLRTLDVAAKPAGTPGATVIDNRAGRTQGTTTSPGALYNQAYLSANGWLRCDGTVPLPITRGRPSRSSFCNALQQVGFSVPSSVAGRPMADVVNQVAADPETSTINSGVSNAGLLPALGGATFPAGSELITRTNYNLNQSIFINSLNTDGRPQAQATTLEQLIAFHSVSGVNLPSPGTSLTMGLSTGDFRNLRVAFTGVTSPTSGTVQYYDCALNAAQNVASDCVTAGTGTYAISTVHGVRVIRFAGHAETFVNHEAVYAEVKNAPGVIAGDWVFRARMLKPAIVFNTATARRLNATAWAAMKTQLGL